MWCHVMPCHAMSFQPSTFNPVICKVYLTHHIFGYMFRFYVVWYLFQTSTGSPCLPEPPLLVQGCQLSQVGGIRPICRHRTWRASWDNFRETQSWSWFMLRPTYPYLPGVCRFSAKDEMSKCPCESVLLCHNTRSCFYGPMNRPAYPVESV